MDVADHALRDHFLGLLVERVAAVLRAHLHHLAGFLGGLHHFLALLDGVRERFFDVDVLAGLASRP